MDIHLNVKNIVDKTKQITKGLVIQSGKKENEEETESQNINQGR